MPNIYIPIQDTIQSVLRPVVLSISDQIFKLTDIPKNSRISYPGDLETRKSPGSGISDNEMQRVQSGHVNYVKIEVDEEYNSETALTTAVRQYEHLPIFSDDKIGVIIKPVYSQTNVNINFKFRGESKSSVYRWRDKIRADLSSMRDVNQHRASYSYQIPKNLIALIMEIHRLREDNAGYNENFGTYIINHSSTRLTELSNFSGEKTELAIAETQSRIMGWFDFDVAPEKASRDGDSDTWSIAFNYKFTFDKPIGLAIRYPVMIHNQILSTQFRPPAQAPSDDDYRKEFSLSGSAFDYFDKTKELSRNNLDNKTITLPWFDEFIPRSIPSGTVSIFNALCQLDNDKCTLCNLNDLDTISLDPDILDFIKRKEYKFMTKLYKSIFQVNLYRGMELSNNNDLEIDSALNVYSKVPLDMRVNHRIRFSIVADLSLLDKDSLDRIKDESIVKDKIIDALDDGKNKPGSDLDDLRNPNNPGNRWVIDYRRGSYFKTVQISRIVVRDGFRSSKFEDATRRFTDSSKSSDLNNYPGLERIRRGNSI